MRVLGASGVHRGCGASGPCETKHDAVDRLHHVKRGTSQTWYTYDSTGQRVRKVTEKGGLTEERLYLGSFEIYRKRQGTTVTLERETLHLMDGARRVAMVETKTVDSSSTSALPTTVTRYQLDNHLQSASLELDETASVISYEEYYPYGDTSYRSARSGVEVSEKRYRYTGKEKDEETGLYYHGARYYAAWLGRWSAADPAGMVDGACLYAYVKNRPIAALDPTGKWSVLFAFRPNKELPATKIVDQQEGVKQPKGDTEYLPVGIEFNELTDTSFPAWKYLKEKASEKAKQFIPGWGVAEKIGEAVLSKPVEVYTDAFIEYAKNKTLHLDAQGNVAKPDTNGAYDKSTKEVKLISFLDSRAEKHFGKHDRISKEQYISKFQEFLQGIYNDRNLTSVFNEDKWDFEPTNLKYPLAFKSMDAFMAEGKSKSDLFSKAFNSSDKEIKKGIRDWIKDQIYDGVEDNAKDKAKDFILNR